MPAYAVNTSTRPRRATRPRRTTDVAPQLPTPKVPDVVTPLYNVVPQDAAIPPPVAVSPTPVEPIPTDDPATAELKRAAGALQTARNAPLQKNSRLKAFLKTAAYALGQVKPGKDWTDVAMQAGAALGGGAAGAIKPEIPGAIQKLYNVEKAEGELATAQKQATTMSMIDRRGDITRQGDESLALRSQKAALDAEFKRHDMKYKDSGLTLRERRNRFLEENELAKRVSKDARDAWDQDYKERVFTERKRQFKATDEVRRGNLAVAQRRAAALEAALQNNITGKAAVLAGDAAEGQALLDVANEYDAAIEGLDKDEDYDEILVLKRAKIEALKQGRAKLAAAKATGEVRGASSPAATRPAKDPLGLFNR